MLTESAVNKSRSKKAQAAAVRRAGVQAVEACSTGQAPALQTGTACEDRDAEAEGLIGPLGVAVFDCILAGVDPSVLVGRVELGSPTLYRVKKVRREVGEFMKAYSG